MNCEITQDSINPILLKTDNYQSYTVIHTALVIRKLDMRISLFVILFLIYLFLISSVNPSLANDIMKLGLPDNAVARLGKGIINDFKYSPDGKHIAVATSIGIWVYETTNYKILSLLTGHTGSVNCISFSPNGQILASGSSDKTVRLWDVITGFEKKILKGHPHEINSIAFSPDGKTIASGNTGIHDGERFFEVTVRLWDISTGELKHTLTEFTGQVNCLAFSPDGDILASGEGLPENNVRLWNTDTGYLTHTFKTEIGSIYELLIPQNNTVIAMGGHKKVQSWDLIKLTTIDLLSDEIGPVIGLELSVDGKTLVSTGQDKIVRIWAINTGIITRKFPINNRTIDISLSANQAYIITTEFGNVLGVWEVETGMLKHTITGFTSPIRSIALAVDDNTIASASFKVVEIWNASTGNKIHTLTGHDHYVDTVTFNSDSSVLASGSFDTTIRLWDVVSGVYLHTLTQYRIGEVRSIAFSPDGNILISSNYQNINKWDVHNRKHIQKLEGHIKPIHSVTINADGTTIASGGLAEYNGEDNFGNKAIYLWDLKTGKYKKTLSGNMGDINCLAFNPDGKLLASGCENVWNEDMDAIILWDVASGSQVNILKGHTGSIYSIVFSPDGKTLASGSKDDTIRLWDVTTKKHIHTLIGHNDSIKGLAFTQDGSKLVSGSRDGTILVWKIPTM